MVAVDVGAGVVVIRDPVLKVPISFRGSSFGKAHSTKIELKIVFPEMTMFRIKPISCRENEFLTNRQNFTDRQSLILYYLISNKNC